MQNKKSEAHMVQFLILNICFFVLLSTSSIKIDDRVAVDRVAGRKQKSFPREDFVCGQSGCTGGSCLIMAPHMLFEIRFPGKPFVARGTGVGPLLTVLLFVSVEITWAEKFPCTSRLIACINLLTSVFPHVVCEVAGLCIRFITILVGT